MKILNMVSPWPGSIHDAREWDNSNVAVRFVTGDYEGLLVGDGGYALSKLMSPVLAPRTTGERLNNRTHNSSRNGSGTNLWYLTETIPNIHQRDEI